METHGHICMIGAALCRNWQLVQRLIGRHGLTLLRVMAPADTRIIAIADIVALDGRAGGPAGLHGVVAAVRGATDAPIVLLDGGLRQADVASLLGAGAHDYFSEPLNVALIAERLEFLADSRRLRQEALAREEDISRRDEDGRL